MSRRFRYTTSLNRGGDTPTWEGEVEVSFSYTPGSHGTPPSYASGGDPPYDAQIDDVRLEKVDGKERPWGMYSGYIADEDNVFATEVQEELEDSEVHRQAMLDVAGMALADEASRASEYRWEAARDDRRREGH